AGLTPAPGAVIERLSHNNSFGFLIMERRAAPATGWVFHAYSAAGKLLASCDQSGTTLACDKTGFIAP
ncbi:serine/threonine protein phosphatase, partial [Burkholderia multivorans]